MPIVHARDTLCVAWSAGTTVLKKGQVWDADADLVRERPDLFTDAPTDVRGRKAGPPAVERATRAPGEVRRGPARPRKARDAEQEPASGTAADE